MTVPSNLDLVSHKVTLRASAPTQNLYVTSALEYQGLSFVNHKEFTIGFSMKVLELDNILFCFNGLPGSEQFALRGIEESQKFNLVTSAFKI